MFMDYTSSLGLKNHQKVVSNFKIFVIIVVVRGSLLAYCPPRPCSLRRIQPALRSLAATHMFFSDRTLLSTTTRPGPSLSITYAAYVST